MTLVQHTAPINIGARRKQDIDGLRSVRILRFHRL
jgi:hypothetical protein